MMIGWQTTKHGRKGTRIGDGGSLSYAGINFREPKDEERLVKEIKRKKKLNGRKLWYTRYKLHKKGAWNIQIS
jgi:hypothetical protein